MISFDNIGYTEMFQLIHILGKCDGAEDILDQATDHLQKHVREYRMAARANDDMDALNMLDVYK